MAIFRTGGQESGVGGQGKRPLWAYLIEALGVADVGVRVPVSLSETGAEALLGLFPRPLTPDPRPPVRRGSALLAVMWLSAALAAFGFALASTVRGEIERASTDLDSLRAYYVASGAVERASLELLWSVLNPGRRFIPKGSLSIDYGFETGVAHVEFLPEAGKLNVNTISPELLARLLAALGVDPVRSEAIAANIVAWRKPGVATLAAPMNLDVPTFETPHASFQGIEEMLNVQGVTPELFYGTYAPAPEGAPPGTPRLLARPGLVDCLSVLGGKDYLDINTAEPAVLAALGTPAEEISAILEARRIAAISESALGAFPSPPGVRFQVEGNSIVTIRATAQARLPNGGISDVKRTVAAMVKYMPEGYDSPIHVLRWYDTAFSTSPWTMRPSPIPLGTAPPETVSN